VGEAFDVSTFPVDRWYRPYTQDGELTVVVFWELWCPHCKREVPKLVALDKIEGVQIVGLTRQTKNVGDADVEKFLADNNVAYAVGHSDDSLHKRLKIKGIPFAIVVHDGKIVWQGNPAGLNEAKLREWLGPAAG
jgi:thiol-disulfide isomerase/thioredoxin